MKPYFVIYIYIYIYINIPAPPIFFLPCPLPLARGRLPPQAFLRAARPSRFGPSPAAQALPPRSLGSILTPNGQQLQALKRILQRLMNGELQRVESHLMQQMIYKQNTVVTAEEWKAVLPHMFIWLDFLGVPQMCIYKASDKSRE